jgi:spermidine/putrescine transport system substrate-binding protein
MTAYKKTLWLSAAVFFCGGILWGLFGGLGLLGPSRAPTSLTLICKDEWIPKETLHEIEGKLRVHIQKTSFSDWSEYARLLANAQGSFDLLCTHSFLARDLAQSHWLDASSYAGLPAYKGLAAEFKDLPFDPLQKYFLPLGWRINGFVFKAGSKFPHTWKALWPAEGKKLSMNHPDLELYARMQDENLEMDPEKQGRYNRNPEEMVRKFIRNLGSIHHPEKPLSEEVFESRPIYQTTNAQTLYLKERLEALEDGVNVWFLLIGVGSQSTHKELARKVINELLSTKASNQLRIQSGFAHVLTHFNDQKEVPALMKATALREFPLRSLRFPDISLDGLPQWESLVSKALQESGSVKKD